MKKAKVLIIEDHSVTARGIKHKLEKNGYEVLTTIDRGEEVLPFLKDSKTQQPDIILCDIMLKGEMNGIAVSRAVSKDFMIPFVFLTAFSDDAILNDVNTCRPYSYILKPFNERELLCNIAIALDRAKQDILIKELHHRMKNNLNSLLSIIKMKKSAQSNPECIEVLDQITRKIYTFTLIHHKLYLTDDLSKIYLDKYLEDLGSEIVASFEEQHEKITLTTELDHIRLPLKLALPCGLVVNEAITNSMKYAFPDRSGTITLSSKIQNENNVILSISDDGVGLGDNFDIYNSKTLGHLVIQSLVKLNLSGTLDISTDGGTKLRISFSLPEE